MKKLFLILAAILPTTAFAVDENCRTMTKRRRRIYHWNPRVLTKTPGIHNICHRSVRLRRPVCRIATMNLPIGHMVRQFLRRI